MVHRVVEDTSLLATRFTCMCLSHQPRLRMLAGARKQVNENGNLWGVLTADCVQPILELDFLGQDAWGGTGRTMEEVAALPAGDRLELRARQVRVYVCRRWWGGTRLFRRTRCVLAVCSPVAQRAPAGAWQLRMECAHHVLPTPAAAAVAAPPLWRLAAPSAPWTPAAR